MRPYFPYLWLALLALSAPSLQQTDDLSVGINMANQARIAQGLQPLAWSSDLAAYASVWAKQMASDQVPFQHAQGAMRPSQGENLFQQQSTQCDHAYDIPLQTAMTTWLAQASLYTNTPVTGSEPWLHWGDAAPVPLAQALANTLTRAGQLMWSTTTQIGCAWAYSISQPYKVYDVCRFFPEGNIIGQKPF